MGGLARIEVVKSAPLDVTGSRSYFNLVGDVIGAISRFR